MGKVLTNRNRIVQVKGLVVGTGGITGPGAPASGNVLKIREVQFNNSAFAGTPINAMPVNFGEKVFSLVVQWENLPPGATMDIGANSGLTGGAAEGNIIANDLDISDEDDWFNSLSVDACPLNQVPDFAGAGYITVTSGGDYRAAAPSGGLKMKMFYY